MSSDSPPSRQPGSSGDSSNGDQQPGAEGRAASAASSLTLTDLAEAIMELGRSVTELAADVEDLQARKAVGGPWWNTDALQPDDAQRLHGTIIAFGDYLKAIYAITALPHRWEDDPALLAELTALYVAWIGAYREPRATATQPLHWHESLHRVIDRIHAYQDRRRQRDSTDPPAAQTIPPLPVAFIPQPARDD